MKQIIKFGHQQSETTFLTDGDRLQAALKELQLEVNYIDYRENRINIHFGISEELKVLPDFLYALLESDGEDKISADSEHFPRRMRIKLSKDDIERLIQSTDTAQGSKDILPPVTSKNVISSYMENDFLNRIFNLMEYNMSNETYWVDDLSCDMNVSRSTLFRKLKHLTGQAPQTFMRTKRLERAVQLLVLGQLRIGEVAYQVGFADPNYFSKCFRKFFGKAPSSFIGRGKNLYLQQMEL